MRDTIEMAREAGIELDLIDKLEVQPAPVQEPVAKVDANDEGYWADILPDRNVKVGQLLYAAAQPAPVQDCFWKREGYKECPAAQRPVPEERKSAPDPKDRRSAWVGLTDDDLIDVITESGCERIEEFYVVGPVQKAAVMSFMDAIEAKLREKNGFNK